MFWDIGQNYYVYENTIWLQGNQKYRIFVYYNSIGDGSPYDAICEEICTHVFVFCNGTMPRSYQNGVCDLHECIVNLTQ